MNTTLMNIDPWGIFQLAAKADARNHDDKYVIPAAIMTETPEAYEFRIELPGVAKEDAALQMDGKTLTLKTHAKFEGFKHANYELSAEMPELADPKSLTAKLENGLMTIVAPKRTESQPKQIAIQ